MEINTFFRLLAISSIQWALEMKDVLLDYVSISKA